MAFCSPAGSGGPGEGALSLEASAVWRGGIERLENKEKREIKGGGDGRSPAIGRQGIGYFGWSASRISLPGGGWRESN